MPLDTHTTDSVCCVDTVSVSVFVGLRSGKDPLLSTAWLVPALPVTGVAVPLWVRAAAVPGEVPVGPGTSPMTDACDAVPARLYPQTRGELKGCINAVALADPRQAVVTRLVDAEGRSFERVHAALASWRGRAPSASEVAALQAGLPPSALAAVRGVAVAAP